jgi:hypothetical protein
MKYARTAGIICAAIMLVLRQFFDLPLLSGIFTGLTICLLLLGLLPPRVSSSIKRWKKARMHRV